MIKLSLPENPDVISILSEVKKSPEGDVVLLLPPKPALWNVLALKTLAARLSEWGRAVEFKAQDKKGEILLTFFRGEPQEKKKGKKRYSLKVGPKTLPILGGGAVSLVAGMAAICIFLPKATLNLKVNTLPLVKITEVVVDPNATAPDSENYILPAIKISVEQEGSFEKATTGEKEVGNKAKGTVTIYNRDTDDDYSFSEGTQIQTENGLNFLLGADVSLKEASPSTQPDQSVTITPTHTDVEALAAAIGSNYNIKKGIKLIISKLDESRQDDVYALASENFSGGDSRTVKTVQTSDQEAVLSQATEELTSQCTKGLTGKLIGDQRLETKTVKSVIGEKVFSPALGEEADIVKLLLKITCEGLAYSEEQLHQLLTSVLQKLVPEGFTLSPESQKVEILTAEEAPEGEQIILQAKIEGQVIQKVDIESIKEAVKGHTFSDAWAYLTTLPHINSYEINFWPPLPSFLRRLPFQKERIEINLTSQTL